MNDDPKSADDDRPTLVGRSSSHFTRVARVFAHELGVPHAFRVVKDLTSIDPAEYAGNPALKIPALETPDGVWFGALNVCRELRRLSARELQVVWPEDLQGSLLCNAQELVVQAMTTEVALIMSAHGGSAPGSQAHTKLRTSLTGSLVWLDDNLGAILSALPSDRGLSYLEVTLFCLATHLDFRQILDSSPYANLTGFSESFGARESAAGTTYRFDA